MKIVSWNMNQYGRWSKPDLAWDFLLNEVKPDIALLQETVIPERYKQNTVFLESYTDLRTPRWGTAIYINPMTIPFFDARVAEEKTKDLFGDLYELGKAVVAEIKLNSNQYYVFASLHIDTGRYGRIPVQTDWPEVDHLLAVFQKSNLGLLNNNFIIGGDLNADPIAYPEHKPIFDWLQGNAFHECLIGHPNTYFGYKRKTTIQDDHLFVHSSMAQKVVYCKAVDYEKAKPFSDHTVIEMEIDI